MRFHSRFTNLDVPARKIHKIHWFESGIFLRDYGGVASPQFCQLFFFLEVSKDDCPQKHRIIFAVTNKFEKLSLSNIKKVKKAFGSSRKRVSRILKGCHYPVCLVVRNTTRNKHCCHLGSRWPPVSLSSASLSNTENDSFKNNYNIQYMCPNSTNKV